jgi:RNA polymerase sigma factor (sigma-70 family)
MMHDGEKPHSDSDFKEVPMDPLAMDTFFTNDRSLWDGNGEDRVARRRFVRKKIAEVKRAMERYLTQRQRETVSMYYFKGKTQTEIGIILGIHQTTVSQHIRYGIKKLKVFCNGNNR